MSPERLAELVARFARARIAVLGDFFLDKYLDVDPALAETSLETGKTAHQVARVRHSPGAAGTVVCNLASLGAGALHAVGFTGDDGESYDLRKDLVAIGCSTSHLDCDPRRMTPTYLKPRDLHDASLAGEHNRYDTKNRTPTDRAAQDEHHPSDRFPASASRRRHCDGSGRGRRLRRGDCPLLSMPWPIVPCDGRR